MGAPSGCSLSVPVTRAAGESGTLSSVVPCAAQPAGDAEISNSSWPTVWPSSWMVNLPLSWVITEALFCGAAATALSVRRAAVTTPTVTRDLADLRMIKLLLGEDAKDKVCHSAQCEPGRSCVSALRTLPASLQERLLRSTGTLRVLVLPQRGARCQPRLK